MIVRCKVPHRSIASSLAPRHERHSWSAPRRPASSTNRTQSIAVCAFGETDGHIHVTEGSGYTTRTPIAQPDERNRGSAWHVSDFPIVQMVIVAGGSAWQSRPDRNGRSGSPQVAASIVSNPCSSLSRPTNGASLRTTHASWRRCTGMRSRVRSTPPGRLGRGQQCHASLSVGVAAAS